MNDQSRDAGVAGKIDFDDRFPGGYVLVGDQKLADLRVDNEPGARSNGVSGGAEDTNEADGIGCRLPVTLQAGQLDAAPRHPRGRTFRGT